jgi:hypothetical protein
MPESWLLLIYTVPAQPSRKRAAVWREVKKAGAIYLRDGVCVLPERPTHTRAFEDIAAKVNELGGQATVVRSGRLDGERADAVISEAAAARADEYDDILREVERFRAHVRREREHRDFTFGEVQELEADLSKLQRWSAQVRERDFVGVDKATEVATALADCEEELATFADAAYEQEERTL